MRFTKETLPFALEVLGEIKELKKKGFNVYDSEQFLDDIENFISDNPLTWRSRNHNVCDAGALYFAVLPDGSLAPCCDWRMESEVFVNTPDFARRYSNGEYSREITSIAHACSGCLYGSYPEITISARFAKASMERFSLFKKESNNEIRIMTENELNQLARKFRLPNG
jgi:hypothetical protein